MSDSIVSHDECSTQYFSPEVYGRLTTIAPSFLTSNGVEDRKRRHQLCRCKCGSVVTVLVQSLKSGNKKSCGCLNKKHGKVQTPEYRVWWAIKNRCNNPNASKYKYYGGRGITVCSRWTDPASGFSNFLSDMGARPGSKYTIDRIDVNGNYCPENCIWATWTTQQRNRRSNHLITHNGKTQCLAAWVEETGLSYAVISSRLYRGWSTEMTLTRPVKKIERNLAEAQIDDE